ncbi:MAG TPA: isoprenylcysteine carboxylmethyltransferase family protein [Blastocatellia bacterium]|nr:isoprenylcysteine carboxylmethyltransferase family protein [Blastocatellia bacterium]
MKPEESKRPTNQVGAVAVKLPGISIEFNGLWAFIPIVILVALLTLAIYFIGRTQSLLWVSAVLWILFIGYWSAVAGNAAATKTSESVASRQLHQLLMYGALVLAFVRVPVLGRRWLPTSSWIIVIGLAVQVISALLAVWARRHLGRNWSGAITAKVDHQLIRTGPYRLVRHPIYSGMIGMFLGTALVSGELHGLLAVVIIAMAYWRKTRLEERHLSAVFGTAYDDYRRKSYALIPGVL